MRRWIRLSLPLVFLVAAGCQGLDRRGDDAPGSPRDRNQPPVAPQLPQEMPDSSSEITCDDGSSLACSGRKSSGVCMVGGRIGLCTQKSNSQVSATVSANTCTCETTGERRVCPGSCPVADRQSVTDGIAKLAVDNPVDTRSTAEETLKSMCDTCAAVDLMDIIQALQSQNLDTEQRERLKRVYARCEVAVTAGCPLQDAQSE